MSAPLYLSGDKADCINLRLALPTAGFLPRPSGICVGRGIIHLRQTLRCPRGVMVKAMECGIVVSKFVLQLRYYVHFRTNTLGKGMNPLIIPAMG